MDFKFLLLDVVFNGVISDFDIEYFNNLNLFESVMMSYEINPMKLKINHIGVENLTTGFVG